MIPLKQLKGKTKMIIYAASAKPNPKLGQALGPLGLNMITFCKEFNEKTNTFRTDVPLRIELRAYQDRTFAFTVKPPPTSWYIKRCCMLYSPTVDTKVKLGVIGIKYIYEIAKVKKEFDAGLKSYPLRSIMKMIMAQCKSMGVTVEEEQIMPEAIITKKI